MHENIAGYGNENIGTNTVWCCHVCCVRLLVGTFWNFHSNFHLPLLESSHHTCRIALVICSCIDHLPHPGSSPWHVQLIGDLQHDLV